ncbi:TetR family transcriptional regulator C-terminal domain-containing protein [Maribacter sp. 1_MG-2023]|uniref:TetR family transcriptional regulator C-terminal domain-containing protein n=1 Tax=Maribacter sp. 1_MG-2023 TaxID=3062677 RepID=UPI0026E311AC|nr:TetR family transcriptional regulator C-terminal domain-containing protein [Maribacter sp. 1_MG-2023]MDO6473433.1 TetR family transcriptional regulator C-terminal domain-containing protein [Maribacter sp. 1_MG-2023]
MPAKAKKVTKETIITMFMDYVLENEKLPKTVYKFCKVNAIKESDFYLHFGSIDAIKKGIWNTFYINTVSVIEKNKEYQDFTNREKMLTFFYTFFEVLTLNRSYILFIMDSASGPFKNMEQLKGLRKNIKEFSKGLIADGNADKNLKITKHNPQLFSEGAWLQTMFLMNFWKSDDSAAFEKTDVAIEKSVNTIFDVFDNTPLENILDFGKFLYKETFA